MVGEITLLYPLVVESRAVTSGESDPLVRIDGPYVEFPDGVLAEAPSFSPLEPVRAYDTQGRQLKMAPYSSYLMKDGQTLRRIAFHGAVAKVEIDSVARSVDVKIRYDVPISDPLPESRVGLAADDERAVVQHPSSRVGIEIGTPEKATAAGDASTAPLPGPGEAVPIPDRATLSAEARVFAEALDALEQVIPQPLAIVQLVVSPPSRLSISLDTGDRVEEWSWSDGELSEPRAVNTQWLQCKQGMSADALKLQRVPAIWDDATRRIGAGEQPMQLVIGQYPCGVAYINVSFESRKRVQYEGDGRFVKVE